MAYEIINWRISLPQDFKNTAETAPILVADIKAKVSRISYLLETAQLCLWNNEYKLVELLYGLWWNLELLEKKVSVNFEKWFPADFYLSYFYKNWYDLEKSISLFKWIKHSEENANNFLIALYSNSERKVITIAWPISEIQAHFIAESLSRQIVTRYDFSLSAKALVIIKEQQSESYKEVCIGFKEKLQKLAEIKHSLEFWSMTLEWVLISKFWSFWSWVKAFTEKWHEVLVDIANA
ncbi:MAG: hypothetical protein ACD_3C00048G0006 [uncultured bacterium (gcode 4)]|uniref:Uncharacterized protein n=1 Tax=uncultured bacterium (gcode 4) TaxID=1234023 RepID=K2FBN4_9BACT|nr:MAG: hypothetical protein ACD_3C00048G0006 [uncultured bacterium (gcode 4)]